MTTLISYREDTKLGLPFLGQSIVAGFPSPAESWVEKPLDLNSHCIKHPDSSYFVRVSGDSMVGAGIANGDIIVVDRAIEPVHGSIVVARVGPELTLKRLQLKPNFQLIPENPAYPILDLTGMDVEVIGVATFAVKPLSI